MMMKIKKYFIALILSFTGIAACNSGEGQKQTISNVPKTTDRIGVGLIHFSLNKTLPLFKTEQDPMPYDSLQFVEIKTGSDKGRCSFQTTHLGKKLQPYMMSAGDSEAEGKAHIRMGLIHFAPGIIFRVVARTAKGVQVVINEQSRETSFIPIDKAKDLRENTDADPGFFDPNFVSAKIPDWFYYETWEQALKRAWYIAYNENELYDTPGGQRIKREKQYNLTVDSVQGDWIRFKERFEGKFFGWTKWKENDSIIVNITLNGGYE